MLMVDEAWAMFGNTQRQASLDRIVNARRQALTFVTITQTAEEATEAAKRAAENMAAAPEDRRDSERPFGTWPDVLTAADMPLTPDENDPEDRG